MGITSWAQSSLKPFSGLGHMVLSETMYLLLLQSKIRRFYLNTEICKFSLYSEELAGLDPCFQMATLRSDGGVGSLLGGADTTPWLTTFHTSPVVSSLAHLSYFPAWLWEHLIL